MDLKRPIVFKRFFGGIISPSTKVQSKTERNKCSSSPIASKSIITRSKSCQSTSRLKPVLKNSNSNKPIVDRCWWIEAESDIPCIIDDENGVNGLLNSNIQQRPHSAMMNDKWRLANNNFSARMTFSGRTEDLLVSIGSRSNTSTSGTLNSFLLPMTSIYDSSCCSSDSPCSSSSLAIPTLLLFDNQNSPIPSPVSIPDPTTRQTGAVSFDKRGEWRRRSADGTEGLQNGTSYRSDNEKQQIKGSSPLNGKWPDTQDLNRCLNTLFPSVELCPTQSQVLTLLLCLRTFISPVEILQKLLQHIMFVQHDNSTNFTKESQRKLFDNVLSFCGYWIHSLPYDFKKPQMRDRLLAVLSLSGTKKDSNAQNLCDELLTELRVSLGRLECYENAIRSLQPKLEEHWERRWETPNGLLALGRSALAVAQQLAHIELERLSMVGLDELVEMLGNSNSLDHLGQQPPPGCIRHYVQWFNQLSQLSASEILSHQHKRHRARCVEFLLEVARECLAIGNFNSLAAIIAGLSAQPVARLKKTWAKVDKSRLEVLQRQLDPSGNFAVYRATLKAAIWIEERSPRANNAVVIPFFGILLRDLFMHYRQCRHPGPNGYLNRMAFDEFGTLMSQLERWKQAECHFSRVAPLIQYLLLSPLLSERSMFLLSYSYEMPDNNADREHLRRFTTKIANEKANDKNHKKHQNKNQNGMNTN
uniref:Ras-GEF domain-containing protein n=1 Tax=Meloidogyne hapla TaxID=6305 RepID=A0A1I8AZI7_MELHA